MVINLSHVTAQAAVELSLRLFSQDPSDTDYQDGYEDALREVQRWMAQPDPIARNDNHRLNVVR